MLDEERKQKHEAERKKQQIADAELRRNEPIDDSEMVDEMFGFIDAERDSTADGSAPSAFRVCIVLLILLKLISSTLSVRGSTLDMKF